MMVFCWLLLITPFQTGQFLNVFLSAFLPQGRESTEQLSEYFNNKIIPRLQSKQLIYSAFDKDKLIGFVIFEKWEESSYYLAEMAIAHKYQRQGLGKQLAFSIFDRDREAERIYLMTEAKNLQAQSFYEKIGFKYCSFKHPDYSEGFLGYEFSRERN